MGIEIGLKANEIIMNVGDWEMGFGWHGVHCHSFLQLGTVCRGFANKGLIITRSFNGYCAF